MRARDLVEATVSLRPLQPSDPPCSGADRSKRAPSRPQPRRTERRSRVGVRQLDADAPVSTNGEHLATSGSY